ncbi:MAG: OmpL47-type beta-barrel domain-containing protein [Promethearchaeota archaeon]
MKCKKKCQLILVLELSLIVFLISYIGSINTIILSNYITIPEVKETGNLKLSNKKAFSVIADPPLSEKWVVIENDGLTYPENYGIDSEGCYLSYEWNDSIPIGSRNIRWKRDVNIKEDMSNYNILSASISTIVNASVHADNGSIGGVDCGGDDVDLIVYGDYVRFRVSFNSIPIGYFIPSGLGNDTSGSFDFLPDTDIFNNIDENHLLISLNQVLKNDHHNFSIIIGIEIFDEDNYILTDIDYWDKIRIKFFNLTFTYELDTPPSIQIYEPVTNQIFGKSAPSFNISITDPYLDSVWYTLDGGITNITLPDVPVLYGSIKQTIWDNKSDGLVTFRVYANDTGGLLNHIEVTIYKDTKAPISSIFYIPSEGSNIVSKSTKFSLTATDDQGSGVFQIFYKINNSGWTSYNKPFDLSNFTYGYYDISFFAIDNAQNIEEPKSILILLKKFNTKIAGYDFIYLISIVCILSITLIVHLKKKKLLF